MSNTINNVPYEVNPEDKHGYVGGEGKKRGVYYNTGTFGWIKSIFGRSVAVKSDEGKTVYIDLKSLKNRFANQNNQQLSPGIIKIATAVFVVRPSTIKDIDYNKEALTGFFKEIFNKFKDSGSENFNDWVKNENNAGHKHALEQLIDLPPMNEMDQFKFDICYLSSINFSALGTIFINHFDKSIKMIDYMIEKDSKKKAAWCDLKKQITIKKKDEDQQPKKLIRTMQNELGKNIELLLENLYQFKDKMDGKWKSVHSLQTMFGDNLMDMDQTLEITLKEITLKKGEKKEKLSQSEQKEFNTLKFVREKIRALKEIKDINNSNLENLQEEEINKKLREINEMNELIYDIKKDVEKNSQGLEKNSQSKFFDEEEDEISPSSEASSSSQNTTTTTATTSTASSPAIQVKDVEEVEEVDDVDDVDDVDEVDEVDHFSNIPLNTKLEQIQNDVGKGTQNVILVSIINKLFSKVSNLEGIISNYFYYENDNRIEINLKEPIYLWSPFLTEGGVILKMERKIVLQLENNVIKFPQEKGAGFRMLKVDAQKQLGVIGNFGLNQTGANLTQITVFDNTVIFTGTTLGQEQGFPINAEELLKKFNGAHRISEAHSTDLAKAKANSIS